MYGKIKGPENTQDCQSVGDGVKQRKVKPCRETPNGAAGIEER